MVKLLDNCVGTLHWHFVAKNDKKIRSFQQAKNRNTYSENSWTFLKKRRLTRIHTFSKIGEKAKIWKCVNPCKFLKKGNIHGFTPFQNLENKQKFEIVWILVSFFQFRAIIGNIQGFTPFQMITLFFNVKPGRNIQGLTLFQISAYSPNFEKVWIHVSFPFLENVQGFTPFQFCIFTSKFDKVWILVSFPL